MSHEHTSVRSFIWDVLGSWDGALLFFPVLPYSAYHILSEPPAPFTLPFAKL